MIRQTLESLDFEDVSFKDLARSLATLVAAIVVAGGMTVARASVDGAVAPSSDAKDFVFARSQIRHFENLLGALTERAEMETNARHRARLKSSLENLSKSVDDARQSYVRAQAKRDVFSRETLRVTLISLQDTGSRAIGAAMDADNVTSSVAAEPVVAPGIRKVSDVRTSE